MVSNKIWVIHPRVDRICLLTNGSRILPVCDDKIKRKIYKSYRKQMKEHKDISPYRKTERLIESFLPVAIIKINSTIHKPISTFILSRVHITRRYSLLWYGRTWELKEKP